MHRAGLISGCFLVVSLVACKKDEPAPSASPAVSTEVAALAKTSPVGSVIAASTHLRIVDPAKGVVAASIDLSRAVNAIAVSPDGANAFVATSGGVYQVDAKSKALLGQLTSSPARSVVMSERGDKVFVLEHDVIVAENGTRDIKPYRMKTLSARDGKVLGEEEIGQLILFAIPSENGRHHLAIGEDGSVRVGAANTPMSEGRMLDLGQGPGRVRATVAVFGGHAYVPVEGQPGRVLDVDLNSGEAKHIALGDALIRGMTVTPDGKTLVVNAVKELLLIDRTSGAIRSRLELANPHQGVAVSADGKFAYLAQTIDGTGGAVGIVELEPLAFRGKVHLDDISPWAIGATP